LYAGPEEAQLVGIAHTERKGLGVMARRKDYPAKRYAEEQDFMFLKLRLIAWRGVKSVIVHNAANAVPTESC